ncbi:hypothetical protein SS50377_22424 [Spironucleus salmonicida]|uniref:Uncharacterized protein n=1 Tax=Spironucleus salmonicida TaxID=348837 RepID=V6LC52_9EUKA|nr:hypothetical protein SS50377_22424 [Spironucleus salmonicida]|eukprot:EST42085.1 Hypothetical protein SS50377_18392 [Spironucleus salmonicida]
MRRSLIDRFNDQLLQQQKVNSIATQVLNLNIVKKRPQLEKDLYQNTYFDQLSRSMQNPYEPFQKTSSGVFGDKQLLNIQMQQISLIKSLNTIKQDQELRNYEKIGVQNKVNASRNQIQMNQKMMIYESYLPHNKINYKSLVQRYDSVYNAQISQVSSNYQQLQKGKPNSSLQQRYIDWNQAKNKQLK